MISTALSPLYASPKPTPTTSARSTIIKAVTGARALCGEIDLPAANVDLATTAKVLTLEIDFDKADGKLRKAQRTVELIGAEIENLKVDGKLAEIHRAAELVGAEIERRHVGGEHGEVHRAVKLVGVEDKGLQAGDVSQPRQINRSLAAISLPLE